MTKLVLILRGFETGDECDSAPISVGATGTSRRKDRNVGELISPTAEVFT
ncbi:MAG: hypothetical protein AAF367_18910 [Pseudomonadota bacterium]